MKNNKHNAREIIERREEGPKVRASPLGKILIISRARKLSRKRRGDSNLIEPNLLD